MTNSRMRNRPGLKTAEFQLGVRRCAGDSMKRHCSAVADTTVLKTKTLGDGNPIWLSPFSRLPVADVLTVTSGNCLVKQPNDVIAREGEVTHRLRRGIVMTGDDCIAIETDEVFVFRAHRLFFVQLEFPAQKHRGHWPMESQQR
jgi:hypothetical protein